MCVCVSICLCGCVDSLMYPHSLHVLFSGGGGFGGAAGGLDYKHSTKKDAHDKAGESISNG